MTRDMARLKHGTQPALQTAPALSPTDAAFLNHVRFVALGCRIKPRTDLFEACALLQVNPTASHSAHAEALVRCLPEALGQPARLHSPGSVELTFDEKWLLALGRALAQDDQDSADFLLGRRVKPENQRLVRYLGRHISEILVPT